MSQTVYTTYWINKRDNVRKEHGTYKSEEAAKEAIISWWEINGENYDYEAYRTNTGALEISYIDEFSFYRIEKEEIEGSLPSTSYTLRTKGEIDAKRQQLSLDDYTFLFDELAEPYRDRLIKAMGNVKQARQFVYNEEGQLIKDIAQ